MYLRLLKYNAMKEFTLFYFLAAFDVLLCENDLFLYYLYSSETLLNTK